MNIAHYTITRAEEREDGLRLSDLEWHDMSDWTDHLVDPCSIAQEIIENHKEAEDFRWAEYPEPGDGWIVDFWDAEQRWVCAARVDSVIRYQFAVDEVADAPGVKP